MLSSRNKLTRYAAAGMMMALASVAHAQTSALQCARLVDVKTLAVLPERTIVVEGKRIARIESGYTAPQGAAVVDLK